MSPSDLKTFIDKSHLEISENTFIQFQQINGMYDELKMNMAKFEALGEPQKLCVKHLADLLAKHEAARLLIEGEQTVSARINGALEQ